MRDKRNEKEGGGESRGMGIKRGRREEV